MPANTSGQYNIVDTDILVCGEQSKTCHNSNSLLLNLLLSGCSWRNRTLVIGISSTLKRFTMDWSVLISRFSFSCTANEARNHVRWESCDCSQTRVWHIDGSQMYWFRLHFPIALWPIVIFYRNRNFRTYVPARQRSVYSNADINCWFP